MALKLLLLTLFISYIALSEQLVRGSIKQGDLTDGYPIYFEIHDKVRIPFVKRDEDIEVYAVGDEKIVSVHVADLTGDGESSITAGGIGEKYVKIHIAGERGEPYRFFVEVRASDRS